MNSTMLNSFRTAMLIPLTVLFLASPAQAQPAKSMAPSASMPMDGMHSGPSGSGNMKQSMMSSTDGMQKMQMSGDTDKDFAMMMKVHHQGAVDMAEMELAHGKSPVMKAMAKKIIAAQKKEIAEFDRWLAAPK